MKRFLLIMLIFTLLFLPHCVKEKDNPVNPDNGNNNNNGGGDNNFSEVVIKGRITGVMQTGDCLSLADA